MTLYKKKYPDPFIKGKKDTNLVQFGHLNALAKRVTDLEDGTTSKGTVTQLTSKTTGVTLNYATGVITTVALTDAADTNFSFTLTNNLISSTSVIIPTVNMNGSAGFAAVYITPGSGSATITVRNVGTAAFNAAIKIGFIVQ